MLTYGENHATAVDCRHHARRPGFIALRSESLAQHFNMLRRLAENWQSGKTALTRRGKTAGRLCRGQLVGFAG
jgi:hypothetical protein